MRIILVGFGTVGQSFLRLLEPRNENPVINHELRPRIVAIVDRGGAIIDSNGLNLRNIYQIKKNKGTVAADASHGFPGLDAHKVIKEVESEILVETTHTDIKSGQPGISHIEECFKNKKNVITTNKGPLALAMPALMELAEYNNLHLRFSGTVGGGTPILDLGKKCLLGDRILSIKGILNGTTNYILSEMSHNEVTFDNALKKAQEMGYAEKDPTLDIDGLDTACKLVILANWVMDKKVTLNNVKITGIRDITVNHLKRAAKKNQVIKLLGIIDQDLTVKPANISNKDLLNISGTLNAITFVSKFAGNVYLIGKGAGGMETASAILRDLIDIKTRLANTNVKVSKLKEFGNYSM